ncbi:MAG: class I SAM-dependent methyltransferase [Actinomycetes bacterium]
MRWWDERVLPRLVDRVCAFGGLDDLRRDTCKGLHGRVLEIGFGSGLNVAHYPESVTEVVAVEPSDVAWHLAERHLEQSPVPVQRGGLDGQRLPFPDASFDSALSTFTLCTIPDLAAALGEVRRVLKPGGELHFVEHGLAPQPEVQRWQQRITPLWSRAAGGCHLDRPIQDLLEGAGLEVTEIERFFGIGPKPFTFFYLGHATRP